MNTHTLKSLVAAAALLAGSAVHAEFVFNGGFEIGQGDGWTLSGNTVFTVFDDFAPQSGSMAAGFGAPPTDPAGLSQTLATTAGSLYRVSFWLQNGTAGTANQPNFFSLNWDGGAVEAQLSNADAFAYTQYDYEFVASSSATELAFSFANFAAYWDLDNVSVSAVPEPSGAALLALGMLACGVATSRRRR